MAVASGVIPYTPLVIQGVVEPELNQDIYPSGLNQYYGYWTGWKNDSLVSSSGIFNTLYMPFDSSGVVPAGGNPKAHNVINDTSHVASGNSFWLKAGELVPVLGSNAIQERAVYLNKNDYFLLGSGDNLGYTSGFSIYAKFIPSGNITGRRILAKHDDNPAQMVLGVDNDGKIYVRADSEDDPYYATSSKDFNDYDSPLHVVGTYGYPVTNGSGALRLYVNNELEDTSARFKRSDPEDRRADPITLGKPRYTGTEGFQGWVDEIGISNYAITPSSVQHLYHNSVQLSEFINEDAATLHPSGAEYDVSFGPSFKAMDTNYIEFTVASSDPTGGIGGAFDRSLWGNSHYMVSSNISFDLDAIHPQTYQVTNDISVDMWCKLDTNHHSGVYITASLTKADNADTFYENLNWVAPTQFIPSSENRFQQLSFTASLDKEVYTLDGKREFRSDFDTHVLNIGVSFPSGTSEATATEFRRNKPFDANFKVYSTKLNVDSFIIPSTGTADMDLYTVGDTVTLKTNRVDLFIESDRIVGDIDLYLQQDQTTVKSSGLLSVLPTVMTTKTANLVTKAGLFDEGSLPYNSMHLFLLMDKAWKTITNSADLFTSASQYGTSDISESIDLFLEPAEASGVSGGAAPSGTVNLFTEGPAKAAISGSLNLYAKAFDTDIKIPVQTSGVFESDDITLSVLGPYGTNDSVDLYLETNAAYGISGSMNMYTQTYSTPTQGGLEKKTTLFIKPPDRSGSIDLFTVGHTLWPTSFGDGTQPRSSGIFLYANGLGSLTNNTNLVTRGYSTSG
tara:strand:- start:6336 stop:8708 length:2373 start_codon:yes stop_codon:yes gene_type:complete